MLFRITRLLVCIISSAMLLSCKTMYMPSMQNVPMFKEKGEIQATVAIHNIQAAYAVTDRVGVIANGFFRKGKVFHLDDGNSYNYLADSFNWELGVGTMAQPIGNTKLEVFAGYGHGNASLTYGYDAPPPSGARGGYSSFHKYFVQPGIINQGESLQVCLSGRISFVDFYDFKDLQNNTLQDKVALFIEPAVTLNKETGIFNFRGQLQFSIAAASPGRNFGEYLPYKSMFLCNVGVTANLTKLLKGEFE